MRSHGTNYLALLKIVVDRGASESARPGHGCRLDGEVTVGRKFQPRYDSMIRWEQLHEGSDTCSVGWNLVSRDAQSCVRGPSFN